METSLLNQAPKWAWWIAGAIAVILPAAYGLGRLYLWWRAEVNKTRASEREQLRKESEMAERTALDAADDVIAHLTNRVDQQGAELTQVKAKLDEERDGRTKCEAFHASTRAMLKLVAMWAKKRGMPTTKELDDLIDEDGSRPHRPLPPQEGGK
jgi:hypothetical protein